ncbi:uncharacterized protein [Maniola hyperantus]|uniref:uncharacterized protein isoform X2 n=1 Tax=Aphantopus hyperantus TaxID=2795564 RepID=UPI00374A0067
MFIKREIPAVNFTTHAVHCARNIRMCPVCKEPVPLADLPAHHDDMHKLLPCAQCGDSVCGTDLEDHVRDSCAHTMKSCRFCAIELRRGELPAHERYCGARTERCGECGEWVMHKYRQLHLDSNHGFIRLDEDPVPTENAIKTTNVPKPLNVPKLAPSTQPSKPDLIPPRSNLTRPLTEIRRLTPPALSAPSSSKPLNVTDLLNAVTSSKPQNASSMGPRPSRPQTNEPGYTSNTSKPLNLSNGPNTSRSQTNGPVTNLAANRQINGPINLANSSRLANEVANLAANEGANVANGPSNSRGTVNGAGGSGSGAAARAKRSNHQPQVNTSAAAPDKVNKDLWASRGAVKKRPAPKPPARAPPPDARRDHALQSAMLRLQEEENRRSEQSAYNLSVGLPPVLSAAAKLDKLRKMDALQTRGTEEPDYRGVLQGRVWRAPDLLPAGHVLGTSNGECAAPELRDAEAERRRSELRNLTPMSAEQFAQRFGELQLRRQPPAADDRFSQIKSSLRELRRGLNEVTAPYNANVANDATHNESVRLPCEFCGAPVLPDDLVQHQTGCRPDLTQYRPASRSSSRTSSRTSSRAASPAPVIPCEFCTAPLPVYLISEHQERCGREAELLYPD